MTDKNLTAEPARSGTAYRWWLVGGIALVVIGIDQLTKIWAVARLGDGSVLSVWSDYLYFTLVYNPGAALSIGEGYTWILSALQIIIVAVVIWWIRSIQSRPWLWAGGLLIGGAIGNIIDRLVREPGAFQGHVVDFIGYFDWFVGNVADIAITFAAVLIVSLALFNVPTRPKPLEPELESDDGSTAG